MIQMRILVLGGSGFLGSHVVDQLCADGHKVVVLDRYSESFRSLLHGVEFCQADFGNRGELENVLSRGIDVVVHLVSSTIPKSSNEDPIFDVQSNLVESIALFEMCVRHSVRKVIFVSSGGTVYGVPEVIPVTEKHPTNPLCSYGITKLAIENYLFLFNKLHGLEYNVLRVSNPYGERQDPRRRQGAVAVFMYKILMNEEITVWGNGSVVRDYLHVSDVAQACKLSVESDRSGVFNVGSGIGLSIKQLLAVLEDALGKKAKVTWLPIRGLDVPEIVLDCSKIRNELFWKPCIDLNEGLVKTRVWMSSLIEANKL